MRSDQIRRRIRGGAGSRSRFRSNEVLPIRAAARPPWRAAREGVLLLRPSAVVLLFLLAAPATLAAPPPAIARPSLAGGTSAVDAPGLVFFLATDSEVGAVAVGTAHTFPVSKIASAGRVDFFTPKTLRRVARSSRFLTTPGRPFSLPGATLRDDFVVYALDGRPESARLLDASLIPPKRGDRVKVFGVPVRGKDDEDTVYGTVDAVSKDRIEVNLDLPQNLRGWGGAPIVLSSSGRVIGILQADVPQEVAPRIFAAPIGGVLEALEHPLKGGKGQPLAQFVGGAAALASAQPAAPAPPLVAPTGGVALDESAGPTRMRMDIDYPPPGVPVGKSVCGVFVAGRATAHKGELRSFDIVMVIDTSGSTADPSGADIDGDGKVSTQRLGRLGSIFLPPSDPGDSILAAEIAAARTLLAGLDPRSTRVGLVSFAGDAPGYGRQRKPAYTLEPLTHDYVRIHKALDALLASKPEGQTHMAAGVDQGTIELLGLRGALSTPDPRSEKIMFFFTDGQPNLPYGPEAEADNVRAVLRAANRAARGHVKIHSFAIGPDALEGPIAVVEMASRTNGYFTPVRDPGDLVSVVQDVSFANLDKVALKNQTTRKDARYFRATTDGAWAGLVEMKPGKNLIRVWARADDGAEVQQMRDIRLDPKAESPPIPPELLARRNHLLEECLRDAKRGRRTAEEEQADQVRRKLRIEIEKERAKAKARAADQRKELKLEGDVGE